MRTAAWLLACCLATWGSLPAHAGGGFPVAGLAPFERPAQAPRLTTSPPIDRKRALHGVAEPIPVSLRFLDDQGGWFNPFLHPGMTGPYDLRGWHDAGITAEPKR